jgi:hypothetical protein
MHGNTGHKICGEKKCKQKDVDLAFENVKTEKKIIKQNKDMLLRLSNINGKFFSVVRSFTNELLGIKHETIKNNINLLQVSITPKLVAIKSLIDDRCPELSAQERDD